MSTPQRRVGARRAAPLLVLALVAGLLALGGSAVAGEERRAGDPRRTRALYVDSETAAATQGPAYAAIARRPQAKWFSNDSYPTRRVTAAARAYVDRATSAKRTPVLVTYSIPDRDCGQHSSGGLPGAAAYKRWVSALARGIKGSRPIVVVEPDAIAHYGQGACPNAGDRLALLRFAVRTLTKAGAWTYLDAAHSAWPDAGRAQLLKRAGVAQARGISTNVSNFRPLADEKAYAMALIAELRSLGVKGTRYVVDTSRNGASDPVAGDVINPTWARLGPRPRLVFKGAFDGMLWVKHPGESDGAVNGGPGAGQWCDLLADRLLGRGDISSC